MKRNIFLVVVTTLGISSASAETINDLFDGIYVQTKNDKFIEIPWRHLYPDYSAHGIRCMKPDNTYLVPIKAKNVKFIIIKQQKLKRIYLANLTPPKGLYKSYSTDRVNSYTKATAGMECYGYTDSSFFIKLKTKTIDSAIVHKPTQKLVSDQTYVLSQDGRGLLTTIKFK